MVAFEKQKLGVTTAVPEPVPVIPQLDQPQQPTVVEPTKQEPAPYVEPVKPEQESVPVPAAPLQPAPPEEPPKVRVASW